MRVSCRRLVVWIAVCGLAAGSSACSAGTDINSAVEQAGDESPAAAELAESFSDEAALEAVSAATELYVETIAAMHGEREAFDVLFYAMTRGYSIDQIERATFDGWLQADGTVLSADGSVATPAYAPTNVVELPGPTGFRRAAPDGPVKVDSLWAKWRDDIERQEGNLRRGRTTPRRTWPS